MKSEKKITAILIIVCMCLSYLTIQAGASSISEEAQICRDLNILGGSGEGVTGEYLASSCKRIQGAIMLLRLTKREEQALEFVSANNFSDISPETMVWGGGRNILAYLKAHRDVGFFGYPDGRFGPNDPFTAQQYYKVLLQSLGYAQGVDFEWTEVFSFAESLGMTVLQGVGNLTMEHVAAATVEALRTPHKGETRTLAGKLVDDGIINETLARTYDLIPDGEVPSSGPTVTADAVIENNSEADVISGETIITVTIYEGATFKEDIGIEDSMTVLLYSCLVPARAVTSSENASFSFNTSSFERLDEWTLAINVPESPGFSIGSNIGMKILLPKEVFNEEISQDVPAGIVTICNSTEAAVRELPSMESDTITGMRHSLSGMIRDTTYIAPVSVLPPMSIGKIIPTGTVSATLKIKNAHETAVQFGYMEIGIKLNGGAKFKSDIDHNSASRRALLDGIDFHGTNAEKFSSQWHNVVFPNLLYTEIIPVSDREIVIKIPGFHDYHISTNETIRVSLSRSVFQTDTIPSSLGSVIAGDIEIEDCGNGRSADTPFEIYAPQDFEHIDWWNCIYVKLMKDIDFEGSGYYHTPAELKAGHVFDGNSKQLSNLSMNLACNEGGLFSKIDNATVKDLWICNSSLKGKGEYYGFIAAIAEDSNITNVHLNEVTIHLKTSGQGFLGGLVGKDKHTNITNCIVWKSHIEQFRESGSTPFKGVGAISGAHYGDYDSNKTIKNCEVIDTTVKTAYSLYTGGIAGKLNGGIIERCVFKGTVWGYRAIGGILGILDDNGTVDECFAYGSLIGLGIDCGGIVGHSWNDDKAQPYIKNCFAGQKYMYIRENSEHLNRFCRILGSRARSDRWDKKTKLIDNRAYNDMKVCNIEDIDKHTKRVIKREFNSNKNGKDGLSSNMIPIPDVGTMP